MFLDAIAQKNMHEKLNEWDAVTKQFVPSKLTGRVDLTDRFLTIYNRPTRKRQIYTRPGDPLPESLVIQHPSSGDIYILGQGRRDARYDVDDGKAYVQLNMLHLVTPENRGSSGLAKQFRKVVKGPPEDPGWLVEELIAEDYLDVEFRTSSAEAGAYDTKIENFYAWTTLNVSAQQWDFFDLHGSRYRVVDTFTDMGMRGLRMDKESDVRVDFTIRKADEQVYDPQTHSWQSDTKEYKVSGYAPNATEIAKWKTDRTKSTVTLVIEEAHIGFTPKPDMVVTYQGVERLIREVTTQAGEKQFKVICE